MGGIFGLDSYNMYHRKYFMVLPQLVSVALITATALVSNNRAYQKIVGISDFKESMSSTLFQDYRRIYTSIYIFMRLVRTTSVWLCYLVFFFLLIINNHNMKNWVFAILLALMIHIHLSKGISYVLLPWKIFTYYSGFVFLLTWAFQFLGFKRFRALLHIDNVADLPFEGTFWGLVVLDQDQLLSQVVKLTIFLVMSVIGLRSLNSMTTNEDDYAELGFLSKHKSELSFSGMKDTKIQALLLLIAEKQFWTQSRLFWPLYTFIAQTWYLFIFGVLVYLGIHWKLTAVMLLYLLIYSCFFLTSLNASLIRINSYHSVRAKESIRYLYIETIENLKSKRLTGWKWMMFVTLTSWICIYSSESFYSLLQKPAH